jgi:hypothetical protein
VTAEFVESGIILPHKRLELPLFQRHKRVWHLLKPHKRLTVNIIVSMTQIVGIVCKETIFLTCESQATTKSSAQGRKIKAVNAELWSKYKMIRHIRPKNPARL